MRHNRTFKVLLLLILLLVFAIPAGLAAASPAYQSSFPKYGPSNGSTITSTSVTFAWSTSSGATSYQFCYDTVNNNSCDSSWNYTGSSTFGSSGTLSNNTTYYWQARANGPSGTVEALGGWWAFTVSTTPPPPTPVPFGKSTPANGATGQGLTTLVAWSSSPNATSYEYCYDTSNNDNCDSGWINRGTYQYVHLTGLNYGTTYYWQVRAYAAGVYSYANNYAWWSFTTMTAPTPTRTPTPTPLPPTFYKYGPGNGATVTSSTTTFAWGSSAGATQYQFCYDTSNNNNCDTSWNSSGTNTTGSTGTLSNNTTYYWQVRAIGSSGAITEASGGWWSFNVSITPPPPTPVPFGKSNPANGATGQSTSPVLAWSASPGALGYEYCLDTFNNGSCDTTWIPRGTNQYVFPSGLTNGTTYSWHVRAIHPGGVIVYSNGSSWAWWTFSTY